MPMGTAEKDDLKAQIPVTRKKVMNFGLSLASKPDETAMLIHKSRKPEMLKKQAKVLGGSPKLACGTVESTGKLMTLTCVEDPPRGMAKKLKGFLKYITGDPWKVQVMDAAGALLESDEDDLEDEDGTGAAAAAPDAAEEPDATEDPPAENLSDRVKAALQPLMPRIKGLVAANPATKAPLQKLLASATQAASAGDAEAAKAALRRLAEAVAKIEAATGASASRPETDQPTGQSTAAGADADAEQAAPDGLSLVRLGKARIEWPDTRSRALDDLARLKAQIEADYADMPEAKGLVDKAVSRLDKSFAVFAGALHEQLDAVLNADPGDRKAEIDAAIKTIDAFSHHVESDPIIAAIDGNDILPDVVIAAPIRAKLQEMSLALGR